MGHVDKSWLDLRAEPEEVDADCRLELRLEVYIAGLVLVSHYCQLSIANSPLLFAVLAWIGWRTLG